MVDKFDREKRLNAANISICAENALTNQGKAYIYIIDVSQEASKSVQKRKLITGGVQYEQDRVNCSYG